MTRERRKRPPGAGGPVAPSGAPGGPRRPSAPQASGVPGRGGNRPGPSLVKTTLLGSFKPIVDYETGEIMEGPVAVSVTEYPDGVELAAVVRRRPGPAEVEDARFRREIDKLGPSEARERSARRRESRESRALSESVRRAKGRVRKIVRYYGLTLMVTLTFPGEGIHEYDRALHLLQAFVHDHGEVLHLGGHYVAVPELHPGGHGWHWHVLVHRRLSSGELAMLRSEWTAFLGRRSMHPSGGAEWVRLDLKDWREAGAAAGYASKYVGKAFDEGQIGKHRRRFLASLGALVEVERASARSLAEVVQVVRSVPCGMLREIEGEDGRPPMVWAAWDM